MIISGSTSSGKTTLLLKFLKHYKEIITPVPLSILYCYGEYSPIVHQLENEGVTVYAGVPPDDLVETFKRPMLLVLDDLQLSMPEKFLSDLFTKKSHHQKIGVICLVQNLFEKNLKVARNNSQYLILTRSPNSALAIRTIGNQLFPKQLSYFLSSYNTACENPYGYIMIDLHAASNPLLKLRTSIFPEDDKKVIFISKNG